MAFDGMWLRAVSCSQETSTIRRITLQASDHSLPKWSAGSHVRIALPGIGNRAYSLLAIPDNDDRSWTLGVQLEADGSGGSRFMHSLSEGDSVCVSHPRNHFALHDSREPAILFAGGIGITPILSMAAALEARNVPLRVHYAGRRPGMLAFESDMRRICGDALSVHYDCDPTRLRISEALHGIGSDHHVYVCGPAGMIEAVRSEAADHGLTEDHIHFESFNPAHSECVDEPFQIEIASTGQIIDVAAHQSIIDAMQAAHLDPLFDCRRGDCGICQTGVLAGIPDHRDLVLSPTERASNKVMHICVSRARTPRLTLDL